MELAQGFEVVIGGSEHAVWGDHCCAASEEPEVSEEGRLKCKLIAFLGLS